MGASRVAHDIERAMGDWVLRPPTLAPPSALAELESRLRHGGLPGLELLEPPPTGPLEGWAAHAAALVSRDGQYRPPLEPCCGSQPAAEQAALSC